MTPLQVSPSPAVGGCTATLLLFTQQLGVGLLPLATVVQQAGWLPFAVLLVLCNLLAGASVLMLDRVADAVPGGGRRSAAHSITTWVNCFCSSRIARAASAAAAAVQVGLATAEAAFLAAMVDKLLIASTGHSYALQLLPSVRLLRSAAGPLVAPFPNADIIISAGYVCSLLVVLPAAFSRAAGPRALLSRVDAFLSIALAAALLHAAMAAPVDRVGAGVSIVPIGTNALQLLPLVLLPQAHVSALPRWLHAKRAGQPLAAPLVAASLAALAVQLLLAVTAARAFPLLQTDNLLLRVSRRGAQVSTATHALLLIAVCRFAVALPVRSAAAQLSIAQLVPSRRWAAFLSSILPWLAACLLAEATLCAVWLSVLALLLAAVDFALPAFLFASLPQRRRLPTRRTLESGVRHAGQEGDAGEAEAGDSFSLLGRGRALLYADDASHMRRRWLGRLIGGIVLLLCFAHVVILFVQAGLQQQGLLDQ